MNSFGILENAGNETSISQMEKRVSQEKAHEMAAPPTPAPAQRPRSLVPAPKFSNEESEELERDGFQVVRSRKERKAAATQKVEEPPKEIPEVEIPQGGRRGLYIALAGVAAAAAVVIFVRILRS